MRIMVLCDIDGVLANCTHRLHYALKEKNFDKYYDDEEVAKDTLIFPGYELIDLFRRSGAEIHFVTSRNERCREATAKWLREEALIKSSIVAMRNENDFRPSPIVKVELIQELFDELAKRNVGFLTRQDMHSAYFIDDDPANVKAVCEAYPSITGIVFGIERMEKEQK